MKIEDIKRTGKQFKNRHDDYDQQRSAEVIPAAAGVKAKVKTPTGEVTLEADISLSAVGGSQY